jgi:serine/threonine protein kinase
VAETALEATRLVAGRYELETPIGKGGMGEVWRAKHLALNSHVAIKFLHGASAQNESARRRFTTEAQVTAQLKTRHAVQVFDFGVTEDGHPFLVMELLEGETLGHRLERCGRLEVIETVRILGQSARALSRAHMLGIVHRDFKPDNIVLSPDDDGSDYVKVLDFGLAKLVGVLDARGESMPPADENGQPMTFTKTGAVLGTPYYMAPEQVRDASEVDLRADIWAFGVVAFECLTGSPPFTGKNLIELFDRVQRSAHPRADEIEPSLPKAFNDWFDTACAPEPSKRFPDANSALKKLLEALDCGKVDLNPSASLGRPLAANRERPAIVVESGDDSAQPNAQTIDAEAKRVQPRSRTDSDESAQFRKLTLSTAAKPALRISDATMSHSIADEQKSASVAASHAPTLLEEPVSKRASRRKTPPLAIAVGVVVALVLAGGAIRALRPSEPSTVAVRPHASDDAALVAAAPAPPTNAMPPASAIAPSSPVPTNDVAVASDAGAPVARSARPKPRAASVTAAPSPPPATRAAPATSAPSATPATPKPGVPDPASYR